MVKYDNRHYITFGGVSSLEYNAFVDGTKTYGAPRRVYTTAEVDGRNGVLTFDTGRYENQQIDYYMIFPSIDDLENFRSKIMAVKGYQRLEDTHHPDEYRMAFIEGAFDTTTYGVGIQAGTVTLKVSCKPQRFLRDGERVIEFIQNGKIHNSTDGQALPLIRVYGHGELGIGDDTITISEHSYDYIDIDCDLQDAFCRGINCNSLITLSSGRFPHLSLGDTGIGLANTITKIEITPRWWKL